MCTRLVISDKTVTILPAHWEAADVPYATDVSGMKLFALFAVQVANCFTDVKHKPLHIQMYTLDAWAWSNSGIRYFALAKEMEADETGVKESAMAEGTSSHLSLK
jgi:hypothetical protein